jgi:hypothetical protein
MQSYWSRKMTASALDVLRELLEKATPGEWVAWDRGIGYEVHDQNANEINNGFRETFSKEDAELIAAMKNALPSLLTRIQELERERDALKMLNDGHQRLATKYRLQAEAAEHRALESAKDAQRYRWLRNNARSVDWSWHVNDTSYSTTCRNSRDEMDSMIDAAIGERERG